MNNMDTYEKLELGNKLLHHVAVQLTQWSHDPETSGRQHQPMENLAIKIFNHLKACLWKEGIDEKLCKICGQGPDVDHNGCIIIGMQR